MGVWYNPPSPWRISAVLKINHTFPPKQKPLNLPWNVVLTLTISESLWFPVHSLTAGNTWKLEIYIFFKMVPSRSFIWETVALLSLRIVYVIVYIILEIPKAESCRQWKSKTRQSSLEVNTLLADTHRLLQFSLISSELSDKVFNQQANKCSSRLLHVCACMRVWQKGK